MRVFLDKSSQLVDLVGKPLGQGGQGEVYIAPHDQGLVVKIWNDQHRTEEMAERVRALSRWPRFDPCVCLPVELAFDRQGGSVVGYVMPRFEGALLLSAFNPAAAKLQGVVVKPTDRIGISRSLAKRIDAMHTERILDPDGNEGNFLVVKLRSGWEVYAIDCDSFEFEARDSKGQSRTFLTDVGKEEYLAPELQAHSTSGKHTVQTDLFSLAVLIWLLLKGGAHPFSIRASGNVRVPPLSELIREGHWPYSPVKPMPPEWDSVDAGIPWAALPKDIRELFIRAFRDGHTDPLKRPHASEWKEALSDWAEREEDLASTARRILGAFQAFSAAIGATWLFQQMKNLPSLFGWTKKSKQQHKGSSLGYWLRIALIILLSAVGFYAAVKDGQQSKDSRATPAILPEWEQRPRESGPDGDRWQGAPKLWKELLRESERSNK